MDVLLGHIVWALMLFRSALSLLDCCYAFSRTVGPLRERLWAGAARELETISILLPVCRTEIGSPWSSRIVASDASPFGVGRRGPGRRGVALLRPGLGRRAKPCSDAPRR